MAPTKSYDLKKTVVSATGLAVLLVILVLVNGLLSYASLRWDATDDDIYSLSGGTVHMLEGLKTPVTVKFFLSTSNRAFPSHLKMYAKRVTDFLEEYEHASKGAVHVEMYDPKADSDEEEWAWKYGLKRIQAPGGEQVYCGLVFIAADQEESIGLLDPTREELLEYDITRIIHRLQSPGRKVVGIVSGLPVFGTPTDPRMPGGGARPWFFVTELKKTYEVRDLGLSPARIDPSVDLLMVIHPKDMGDAARYAVDQYVVAGGNAFVFVDPLCVSDMSRGRGAFMNQGGSSLGTLFEKWGISFDPMKAVADLDQPTRLRTAAGTVENNPAWISARADAFSASNVVTSKLETMLFPVAGGLGALEGSGHEFESLIRSGTHAALVDSFKAGLGATAVRRDVVSTGERFTLAARVRGTFSSAFPEGPPPADKDGTGAQAASKSPHLKTGTSAATVVVAADADMLSDRFSVQRSNFLGYNLSKLFNDNLNFVFNTCEILTGSDDLIELRSRGTYERPFTAVMELERRAQERWLAKEKELVGRAEATNLKLRELEQQKDESQKLIISPEQEREVAKFREQKRKINHELKQVRKNLRADIESLGIVLKAVNIFLMPLCVAVAGLLFALFSQRRMRRQ